MNKTTTTITKCMLVIGIGFTIGITGIVLVASSLYLDKKEKTND